MLDKYALKIINPLTQLSAQQLDKVGLSANQVSLIGFILGLIAVPLLALQYYLPALFFIALNRIADGLDGALARRHGATSAGAFLDISCDFIFYSAIVLGFALANPNENSIAATTLILSFMATGSTFLAFAILAQKHQLENIEYPSKGFYYIGGITEGTETILLFLVCCLLPQHFSIIAYGFASLCFITAAIRLYSGFVTLQKFEQRVAVKNRPVP
ncbi:MULTISPECIES: CDP-alcohol phosphatidyltransferase family protein [unclassified Motilimonas]|uniref:CDP-alcohol phosphatidyltransferase family protein n=1 Tax=Motilimonas TaxID=1914248 RepID=UPI001E552D7F|nr:MULTISPECIES: CDP-alcohol phosphatidyltransferase family protein [unclassified Motilimonas]MCE0556952.1 CDP-alcohol phosphatidyltransferase family protein [Motilimonas sp. E26]MDO6525497.1 CDP-alcohol phosphatidyltransferase family protein [Motilimonas sp. 1_MG-2023]